MGFLDDDVLEGALGSILSPFTHYIYSVSAFLILVSGAIVTWLWMWSRQRAMLKDVAAASDAVTAYSSPDDFTENFGELSHKFKQNQTLRRSWEEFEETLIPPLADIDDPSYRVFRNTKRPSEFFQSADLLRRLSPFFKPEDFIGIGLLLTFLGLVAALVVAGSGLGVDGGDAAQMKSTILKLLETAGAKFIASIGGVTGSLVVSISQHRLSNTVSRRLDFLADALEERLVFASAEKIAADQYGHMMRQTANLERLSNEIAVAIGDKIESAMSKMPGMMGEAMQPVTEKLDNVAGQIGQSSSDGMAEMVNQLSSELKGAGQESMQQVVAQLDSLSTTMGGTVNSLRDTTELLKESLTGSARQAASDLSGSSEVFSSKINDAVESMERSQQGIRDTMAELVNQLKNGSVEFDEKLSSTRSQMQDQLVSSLGAMNAHISRQASQASEEWQSQIKTTIAQGAEATSAELQNAARNMSEQLKEPVAEVQSGLRSWVEKTSELTTALELINNQLGAHREGLSASTARILDASGALESASGAVRETTIPMRDAASATKDATEQLLTITKSTAESVSGFSTQVGDAVVQTKQILEALEQSWRAQAGQLENADAELARAFSTVTTNLTASLGKLSDFHQGMDKNLARAVEGLSALVDELSDSVDAIPR